MDRGCAGCREVAEVIGVSANHRVSQALGIGCLGIGYAKGPGSSSMCEGLVEGGGVDDGWRGSEVVTWR